MPRVRSMPATAYNRTVSTIKDYPRMLYEYEQLKRGVGVKAVAYDGMPKGNTTESGVEEKAIRLADLKAMIDNIESVIATIPCDMKDGILNNIYYGWRFPLNEYGQLVPSLRTWQREKEKFIILIAHKLRIY